jgi:hypothetical protein
LNQRGKKQGYIEKRAEKDKLEDCLGNEDRKFVRRLEQDATDVGKLGSETFKQLMRDETKFETISVAQ